jgi:hypothetical protein
MGVGFQVLTCDERLLLSHRDYQADHTPCLGFRLRPPLSCLPSECTLHRSACHAPVSTRQTHKILRSAGDLQSNSGDPAQAIRAKPPSVKDRL